MDQRGYPEIDRSMKHISFQLHPRFKPQRSYDVTRASFTDPRSFQYDFSLEERLQEIFLKKREDEGKAAVSEDGMDGGCYREVVIDEGDDQTMIKSPPPIPPRQSVDKRLPEPNDSGVSSSNSENGTEDILPTFHTSSKILQPAMSSLPHPMVPSRSNASLLDAFESSNDDPWEAARISSINEREELKSIFTQSTPTLTSTPAGQKLQKPKEDLIVADIQSLLAQRRSQTEQERKQNFSKSALAALNSLPVIEARSVTPTQRQPSPVISAKPKTESEKFTELLVEMGYNRCIIAKATQLFPEKRTEIMDYLNAYTVLTEAGHSSAKVLQVLQICENSLDESKVYFEKSPKYIEMGFDLVAIRKALIRYPNEPSLQLESLVQGRV